MVLSSCYMVQNGGNVVEVWWKWCGSVVHLWQLEINEARKTDGADVVEVWRKSVESVEGALVRAS